MLIGAIGEQEDGNADEPPHPFIAVVLEKATVIELHL
jgi:hypothetical protein